MTMLGVDFNKEIGKIRRINGVNLAPPLHNSRIFNMNTPFQALNTPIARFHDAPLDNPGMRVVDPNLIFANWHADEEDPRNYYFKQTDDYLQNCRDLGTEIHYRLGPSIEHTVENYFIHPPEDYDKWVDICSNIISHYNENWNNGFNWNITYWTIWEEPENKRLFSGEPIEFFRLFKLTVARLKERFPGIKLGTCIGNHLPPEWVKDFLSYCRDEKVPMDFFGWSLYMGDLNKVINFPNTIRELIDGYGFQDTELHVCEWNYTNRDKGFGYTGRKADELPEGCYGFVGAAFAAAALIGWLDTTVTMTNFYSAGKLMGLFDKYGVPKKIYYGLLAFGEITKYENRVTAETEKDEVKILAGRNSRNEGAVLVSSFKSEETKLKLRLNGIQDSSLEVLCVNPDLNLEPVSPEFEGTDLILDNSSGSSVFLIKGIVLS